MNLADWLHEAMEIDNDKLYRCVVIDEQGVRHIVLVACDTRKDIERTVRSSPLGERGGKIVEMEPSAVSLEDAMGPDNDRMVASTLIVDTYNIRSRSWPSLSLDFPVPHETPAQTLEDALVASAAKHGREAYVEYYPERDSLYEYDNDFVIRVMDAYRQTCQEYLAEPESCLLFEQRMNQAIASMLDRYGWMDNGAYNPYEESCRHCFEDFAELITQKLDLLGIDVDDDLEDLMEDAYVEAALEADNSQPLNLLKGKVTMNVAFAMSPDEYIDDCLVRCDGMTGDSRQVEANEPLRRMLETLNVSANQFVDEIKRLSGNTLELSKDREDWSGAREAHGSLDAWSGFDPDKASCITPGDLVEIIDSTNGHGTPLWSINVELRDFLRIAPTARVTLEQGWIGIHDFINGSGWMDTYGKAPATVRLGEVRIFADQEQRWGVHEVYGPVPSTLNGRFEWDETDQCAHLAARAALAIKHSDLLGRAERGTRDDSGLTVIEGSAAQTTYLKDAVRQLVARYGEAALPEALSERMTSVDREAAGLARARRELVPGGL